VIIKRSAVEVSREGPVRSQKHEALRRLTIGNETLCPKKLACPLGCCLFRRGCGNRILTFYVNSALPSALGVTVYVPLPVIPLSFPVPPEYDQVPLDACGLPSFTAAESRKLT
jgi:hypothetical protein